MRTFRKLMGVLLILLGASYAYGQAISISYKNQPLAHVLSDLSKKSGYDIVYQKQILERCDPVTVSIDNASLTEILDYIFFKTNLDYDIVKKSVVIHLQESKKPVFKRLIKGVIVDENNDPLPGVNVRIKGTMKGTVTDVDGRFGIEVDSQTPILLFSNVGMKDRELVVTNKTSSTVTVKMADDVKSIREVVVTGYQRIKRENATGAFQTVTAKDMDQRATTDVVSSLEGKIPGLVTYRKSNGETGEAGMTIRGISSMAARTTPLVVVDGLPIEGSISTINPYEIENITVLKDASASSLYGARASNGVIVVTTKQAKFKKVSIDFNSDITISEKMDYSNYNLCNAQELLYLEQQNFDMVINDPQMYKRLLGSYQAGKLKLSSVTQLMMQHHLGDVSTQDYTKQIDRWKKNSYQREWENLMLRNQVVQQYNLAIRAKGDYLSSSVVVGYRNDNTGLENQHNSSLNMNYRGDLNATKWLNFTFGLNVMNAHTKQSTSMYDYKSRLAFPAYMSMYNDDGSLSALRAEVDLAEPSLADATLGLKSEAYNLVNESKYNYVNGDARNIRSFIHANVQILPELKLSGQFQYEDNSGRVRHIMILILMTCAIFITYFPIMGSINIRMAY